MGYEIDVIIPIYSKWESVKDIVDVFANNEKCNIIVVNDGYKKSGPKLKGYSNLKQIYKANGGFASAVNYGVKSGNAPFILILNSDIRIDYDTVLKLEECIKSYDAVMPIICKPDGKIESLGMKKIFGNMWVMNKNDKIKPQALPFTCIMIKREKWRNGLCEDYYLYYEDIDFFERNTLNIGICKNTKVVHYHSKTIKHKYLYLHRARWIYWEKHSRGYNPLFFILYILWDIISITRSFIKGYFIDAMEGRRLINWRKSR